jgi:hypothetical protein
MWDKTSNLIWRDKNTITSRGTRVQNFKRSSSLNIVLLASFASNVCIECAGAQSRLPVVSKVNVKEPGVADGLELNDTCKYAVYDREARVIL